MSSFLNVPQIEFLFCCFFHSDFLRAEILKISLIAKLSVCFLFSSFFSFWFSSFFQSKLGSIIWFFSVWCWSHCAFYNHTRTLLALTSGDCVPTKPLTHSPLCFAREVVSHRVFSCLGGPHLNLRNCRHVFLIQVQTKTPLRTYMEWAYMQGTCPCLTGWCWWTPSELWTFYFCSERKMTSKT